MTLKRSKYTGNFTAQCDGCHEIMDFEDEDNFFICTHILRTSSWVSHKNASGVWRHTCPDCTGGHNQ
jgi:hypothetical protein